MQLDSSRNHIIMVNLWLSIVNISVMGTVRKRGGERGEAQLDCRQRVPEYNVCVCVWVLLAHVLKHGRLQWRQTHRVCVWEGARSAQPQHSCSSNPHWLVV